MSPTPPDPWQFLCDATAARIALGRCGGSLPTRELLDFNLAHARARDAVHVPLDVAALCHELELAQLTVVTVASAAVDREVYLRRPDLGRRLDPNSRETLRTLRDDDEPCDLVVVVSDGLSAPAAQRHAAPLATKLVPRLSAEGWRIAPLVIVRHGRVAIADEIGELLQVRLALILIGERPGMGSPDSLGAYLVYEPHVGRTDAERNCVSNIRLGGLPIEFAADTLHYLLSQARTRGLSGIALKDERGLLPETTPVHKLT